MIELIILGSIQLAVWGSIGVYKASRSLRRRLRNRNNMITDSDIDIEFYTTPRTRIRVNEPLPKYEPIDPMTLLVLETSLPQTQETLPTYESLFAIN